MNSFECRHEIKRAFELTGVEDDGGRWLGKPPPLNLCEGILSGWTSFFSIIHMKPWKHWSHGFLLIFPSLYLLF